MELSTKKASGEFLQPIQKTNGHHSDVDDENSESQKKLISDHAKRISELDEADNEPPKITPKKPQKMYVN